MARRVFFSFNYNGDKNRIGIVRNHGMCKDGIEDAGYIDAAEWETLKLKGAKAVQDWIDEQLEGTSLTAVLIGQNTSEREWVQYEIEKSFERGNALMGIYIHNLLGLDQKTVPKGANPFGKFSIKETGESLESMVPTYDWKDNDGYNNFSAWVESAIASWEKPNGTLIKKGGSTGGGLPVTPPSLPRTPAPGPKAPPLPPRNREVG